jgi:hypothetical protein
MPLSSCQGLSDVCAEENLFPGQQDLAFFVLLHNINHANGYNVSGSVDHGKHGMKDAYSMLR